MFDPAAFLDQVTTEANSTKATPVPVGEYTGVIKELKTATWQSKDGTKSGVKLQVVWTVEDPSFAEALGRDSATIRQDIMLDLTESNGLDFGKGKNIGLGKLREAVGLNRPGQPFSPSQLVGQCAKVSVTHRIHEDQIFAEVKGVAGLL
jgi:hypothetical protein